MTIEVIDKNSYYGQSRDGNKAVTRIDAKINDRAAVIEISTCKRASGLTTTASVMWNNGDGSLTCILFEDFRKQLVANKARATEKAIKDQMAQALDGLDALLAEIDAFYIQLAAKKAA